MNTGEPQDLLEFLISQLDSAKRALDEHRDHRERGDHINHDGQRPGDFDEHDSCHRCIATAKAVPYRDVGFGLLDIEAKRQIISAYEEATEWLNRPENRHYPAGEAHGLYTALKLLAWPYHDRPGYGERSGGPD